MHTKEIERPATGVAVKPGAPPINQDLITLDPQRYVALVYEQHKSRLAKAIAESASVVIDCTTVAGLAIATKWRALFRDEVRVAAESTRVDRKAPILTIGRLIDSEAEAIKVEAKLHEDRFDAPIKAEVARKEAVKVAEQARKDTIKRDIQSIRDMALLVAGKSSVLINASCGLLSDMEATTDRFAEYVDDANAAINQAYAKCEVMLSEARAAEAAEAQRLADIAAADKRRAEEAAENARAAAENQRIAAANAAAAKALADQQAALDLAATKQREQAEANLRADAAARAEADRLAQVERDRVAAAVKVQMDSQQAEIVAARQALTDEQAAAAKAKADALAQEQADAARDEGFTMDLQFDIDAAAAAAQVVLVVEDAPAPVAVTSVPPELADAVIDPVSAVNYLSDLAHAADIDVLDMLEQLMKFDLSAAYAELVDEATA